MIFKIFTPVVALITILVLRWIFIVGYGDFGTDYDYVSRVYQGQWQGLDFFAVFPPLSGYTLLAFSKIFGTQYITINIHLWFWWAINSVTSAMIMHAYKGVKEMSALVAVTVALLTIPTNMHGVSFAYIAASLCGMSVLFLLAYEKKGNAITAIAAGFLAGLAILSKPNVGIGILGAMIFICIGVASVRQGVVKKYLKAVLWILLGAFSGFFVAFAIPGWHGGYLELAREIFLGGNEIKGGIVWLILRTIPRIPVLTDPNFRWIAELCISLPLIGLFTLFFVRLRQGNKKLLCFQTPAYSNFAASSLWLLVIAISIISIWSIWPKEFPLRFTALVYNLGLTSLPFSLWQLLYIVIFTALAVALFDGVKHKEFKNGLDSSFWATMLALIWLLATVASGRHNSVFAATLYAPVLVLQYGNVRAKIFYKTTIGILVLWTLAWHVAPNWKSTFAELVPLPANGKFAGLYWPEGAAQLPGSYPVWKSSKTITELTNNLTPRVENKRVLWLTPGPGSAFGGDIYSFGIHGLSSNNVTLRGEKRLGESVYSDLPDSIVISPNNEWNDLKWTFLHPDILNLWLNKHYEIVWRSSSETAPIYLWEKIKTEN